MTDPLGPANGWGVLHLFVKPTPLADAEAITAAVKDMRAADHQVVCVAVLGHKADALFMAFGPDWTALRAFQTKLQHAGLEVVDSYVSLTELSEYSQHLPEHMKQQRLFPQFPPEGKRAYCFYPMSKRRDGTANWYTAPFEERDRMMRGHGTSGRAFAGRITQLITGSTGLDDYEWGVTLFGVSPEDLKEVVYTLRYDEASALYADFGPFYAGYVVEVEDVAAQLAS